MIKKICEFPEFEKFGKGTPYLMIKKKYGLGFVYWDGDGTLKPYEAFTLAARFGQMNDEILTYWNSNLHRLGKKSDFTRGINHGFVFHVPYDFAEIIFDIVKRYFEDGLKRLIECGIKEQKTWDEYTVILNKLKDT